MCFRDFKGLGEGNHQRDYISFFLFETTYYVNAVRQVGMRQIPTSRKTEKERERLDARYERGQEGKTSWPVAFYFENLYITLAF